MKKLVILAVTLMMGAAYLYVPAVSFGAETDELNWEDQTAEEQAAEPTEEQVPELSQEQIQREQVVAAAQSQAGYLKGEGDDIYTLEARELGHSAVNGWCGRFVWWCFYSTGNSGAYYDGLYTGSPQMMIDWAYENDLLIDSSQAQPGDILIKLYAAGSPHAGLIESVDSDGTIHTLERNHYQCEDGVYRMTRAYADYIIRPQYGQ